MEKKKIARSGIRFTIAFFVWTFTVTAVQIAIGQPPAAAVKKDTSSYRQMVEKIRGGNTSINFGDLRKAYVDWLNDGNGVKESPKRDEMVKAFEAKNYARAVELGEIVADYEFVNSGILGAIAEAYKKLGSEKKAALYADLSHRAKHGLYLSGDGKNVDTAYYVMNIDEEYKIMRGLGYAVGMQSLTSANGQSFDVLSGKDEDGKTVELYFNICSFFGCGKKK